jgi:mercuric ion binding protein
MLKRVLLVAAMVAPSMTAAAEKTMTLAVENMTCALCPITVSRAVQAVPGVVAVEVDLNTHTAVMVFDDAFASGQQVADAATNAGYPARPAE